ncbi:hypothetical protein MMC13_005994 [Lambiella insularis]|nr:hypothetical protein [Lambiella insularis]
MAANGEDQASSLQSLFDSLRANVNRGNSPSTRTDENTGPQSYPFNFTTPSIQPRINDHLQSSLKSPDISQSRKSLPPQTSSFTNPTTLPKSDTPNTSDQSGTDRTTNLLNLLKFNHPGAVQSPSLQQPQGMTVTPEPVNNQSTPRPNKQPVHSRGVSASDLVASFMGRPSSSVQPERLATPSASTNDSTGQPSSSTANPQDFLLQLLNRPKPQPAASSSIVAKAETSDPSVQPSSGTTVDNLSPGPADSSLREEANKAPVQQGRGFIARKESPIRIFGTESKETTPFEPQDMPKVESSKEPIFSYINPFEQLAASSPRNAKPRPGSAASQRGLARSSKLGTSNEGFQRKSKEPSPMPVSTASRRKFSSGGNDIMQSIESPAPQPLDDGRTQIEALIGIGAPTTDAGTVAEALNEVGEQVSRQVDHALAQAAEASSGTDVKIKHEELGDDQKVVLGTLQDELQEVAVGVKADLEKEENAGVLEEMMPASVAEAIKDIIDEAAEGDVDGIRAHADDERSTIDARDQFAIPVYNFPMKPFVSIDLKQDELSTTQLREESILEIARLKKDFDQIDRTLATASDTFILYAMPKVGGLRIIRQDDGEDRQVFRETHDRIFNAAISTAPPGAPLRPLQTFIATGMSGAVYWATISHENGDCIQEDDMEKQGLCFPPIPAHDENTSGGQLKTRAKKSIRHPNVFAIGRGKSIQLVFPFHARESDFVSPSSVVNTEKYFKERNLRINTGKAGKDFTFSEDDTVITTLDKAGRLRFWDIRELMHESNGVASKIAANEVKTPLMTFTTAVSNEKSWPTSVLYVDKLRPYTKCIALRYLIVGMKQNHTLQLWDLGLGKAVQELNFPHQKESDAICSVSYHSASGMIVVGHPTRNSIYFIHLSAPKYNLTPMSQAKFLQRLHSKDSTLPKPESTAIMSGMREYSFSSKGQLRSIDLLPVSNESTRTASTEDDPSLFELYVMHSKGVICLNIKKEDLGWSQDTKVMNPMNAEEFGIIQVRDLHELEATGLSEKSSVNGDSTPMPLDRTHKGVAKADYSETNVDIENGFNSKQAETVIPNGTASNGNERAEKKKKKRTTASIDPQSFAPQSVSVAPDSYAAAAHRARSPSVQRSVASNMDAARSKPSKSGSTDHPGGMQAKPDKETQRKLAEAESISLGIPGDFLDKEFKKIEKIVSGEFANVLGKELDTLYRRFDEDKRVQDAAGAAKQDAILRLVSSTLTDNVDKALSRIINNSVQQLVLPTITQVTVSTLNKNVPEQLTQQLLHTLPAQLKLALPEAVSKSIQQADVLRVVSDQVTTKIANLVERQFSVLLNQTILPSFQNVAFGAAQRMSAENERRMSEQLQQVDVQRREDSTKIDQLTTLVRGLSETIHAMAAAQSGFQSEILKLQQQSTQARKDSSSKSTSTLSKEASTARSNSPEIALSPEQQELRNITALMKEGRFEEGTIQWLQSKQQADLFDGFFVKCNPAYLGQCQSLVTLSVGAAVTASLDTNLVERLEWLESVLTTLNPQDPDIRGVAPKIMNVLCQRLESQYMRLAEMDNRDPVLQKIPPLTRRAREIGTMTG